MSNLASLDLVLPPNASRVLAALRHSQPDQAQVCYRRLSRLSCNFALDNSLLTFLERTPALRELQLGDASASASGSNTPSSHPVSQSAASFPSPPLPASALPNLALFMGSCADASLIVPGRPLESVHLYSGDLSEDVLDALARSSTPITIFGSLTNSLSPSILHALASSLPHLQHLRIMTMYHSSNHPGDVSYIHRHSSLWPTPNRRLLHVHPRFPVNPSSLAQIYISFPIKFLLT